MTTLGLPSRYQARSLLGEGSSGRVYRVMDSIRNRELALKLVTPAESAWLRREFDTFRQIRHENLVQVFDWGTLPSGEAYYTMELVEGGDWGRRMGTPQLADEVRRVVTALLRGLAHLHCHGEVHGDLKPGNILLGVGSVVKITDAGMGGGEGAASSSGTPGYAAPEVWEGATADVRSDLYSVGVMAYEALTGRPPFAGHSVREVVSGQLEGWVPSPAALGVEVPADIERVIMRAVERTPGLRQGSADEFMEGLGAEDRIGEILGGRVVGREKETGEIEGLLYSAEPGTPTLVYVSGEPGMGKGTLLERVAHRVISANGKSLRLALGAGQIPQRVLLRMVAPEPDWAAKQKPMSPSVLAEVLVDSSIETPLFVWATLDQGTVASNVDWVRSLFRCVWAVSLERRLPSRAILGISSPSRIASLEPFEHSLHLTPFSRAQTLECVQSVLGRSSLEREFIGRIHLLAGGNPGATRSCLASLIDRGLVHRRAGIWVFRERIQIQDLEMTPEANPWAIAWDHLNASEIRLLTALALLPNGLRKGGCGARLLGDQSGELLAGLESKGWVRSSGQRWSVFSEAIRELASKRTTGEFRAPIAKAFLSSTGALIDREDMADLALSYCPAPEVLEEGLWAAEEAARRSDHRTAVARLRVCLGIASALDDRDRGSRVSLMLGDALHQLGDDSEAIRSLSSEFPWTASSRSPSAEARRSHLLGTIERSRGNLDIARNHFLEAIRLATTTEDPTLVLKSHAGLAEIDWRHESEALRSAAIVRVRSILGSDIGRSAGPDERANLTYQLGAGLILSGEFADAHAVLLEGLDRDCSDYWRMRLVNALASSAYYRGDFETALNRVNQAWQYAESSGADSFKTRILANRAGIYYGMGRPRDAVDQHVLATHWAMRIGSAFECLSAHQGRAINLILLARYEESLIASREAEKSAKQIGDEGEQAKALELQALGYFHVGDYEKSEQLVGEALHLLQGHGYSRLRPRLDWLQAKHLIRRDNVSKGEELLRRAEEVLRGTRDWEDLPGVQIELHLLRSRREDPILALRSIIELMRETGPGGALVVQLYGAFAITQIMLNCRIDDVEGGKFVATCLERADRAGTLESSWWFAYFFGEIAVRQGDVRHAQSWYTRALRVLREIADSLSPQHRRLYLRRPHTRSALDRIATVK